MNKSVGWILDVYIRDEKAVIWFRKEDNKVLKLFDSYSPSFYILPRNEDDGKRLFYIFKESPHTSIAFEEKYTTLDADKKRRLLCVTCDRLFDYKRLIEKLELLSQVKALYNADLLHIQQYLFKRLDLAPTSKIELAYNNEKRIISTKLIDDSYEIQPPPFTDLLFAIHTGASISPNPQRDPITCIEVKYGDEENILQGEERTILEQLASFVKTYDPDFIVCPNSIKTINYIFQRVSKNKLNLQFGRREVDIKGLTKPLPYSFRGRVVLDYGYFEDYGIAGLVERSRFSVLPPGIASRWTANRIIDSRNCYELLKRESVIPKNVGYYQYIRTVKDVVDRDRGGLIISTKTGVVHENVAEFDFESQYPNLIVNEGLSYETVTSQGLLKRADALLPHVTRQFLDRRLRFKRLRKKFDENSREWKWCEQRQLALKMILVCLYGTSGCCWNRFGNVLCFEEINRLSRRALVKTKNFVQHRGFEVVYADTDSIFVKKKSTSKEEYEELSREISQHLGLPIVLDHHYKFLLLLPLRADRSGSMEAQKRYFGLLTNGKLLARGIEIRRHDYPKFIKNFQTTLIYTLLNVKTAEDVWTSGYRKAVDFIIQTINRLMNNEIPVSELTISKILRKPLSEYTRLFPHVSAAINLAQQGKPIRKGDMIHFIYVNAKHHNPLRRVAPLEIYDSAYYDREKYRDMTLDAAETILSPLGFSRQRFGLKPKS